MAKKLPKSINLLDPVFKPNDVWDKMYDWIFGVGQYLLIFVQVIVIIVFVSRLVLDKRSNDLTEEINQSVETLSSDFYKNNELRFSNIHALLGDLRVSSEEQQINSILISSVVDSIPSNVKLLRYSFNRGTVSMAFKADTFQDIRVYEQALKDNSSYKDLSLRLNKTDDVSSDIDFSVTFTISSEEEEEL